MHTNWLHFHTCSQDTWDDDDTNDDFAQQLRVLLEASAAATGTAASAK